MSVRERLQQIKRAPPGTPLDWVGLREDVHSEFNAASSEAERAKLLAIFTAIMDQVERSLAARPDGATDLKAFRDARKKDYYLFLIKECLVGENVDPEKMEHVTRREIAAGRMLPDDEIHKLAAAFVAVVLRNPEQVAADVTPAPASFWRRLFRSRKS